MQHERHSRWGHKYLKISLICGCSCSLFLHLSSETLGFLKVGKYQLIQPLHFGFVGARLLIVLQHNAMISAMMSFKHDHRPTR